ncbi:MAG: SDR family NAD(P)-dependent oxidoreductase [Chloroflexi bacterium]|nr:SDR family NAD(P)-dependent oxidoreductase [Chloroflexota bacterium]
MSKQAKRDRSLPIEKGEVGAWMVSYFAGRLGCDKSEIDISRPFVQYGLASIEGISLVRKLEEWLGLSLSPTLAWEYPSIELLARHLAGNLTSAEEQSMANTNSDTEPMAIVGMAGRFPGAKNLAAFWQLLHDGVDAITEIPPDRWNAEQFYSPDPAAPGKMISPKGGFLEEIDKFDAAFFGISPREAAHLDPQQRLMLELAWEALENAGIPPFSLAGSQTGVFFATLGADYGTTLFSEHLELVDAYSGPGNAYSVMANRVSYFLDLHGPSISLDTACSGSLVALHLACQSLRSGESSLALVGGVNVILRPDSHVFFSKAGALSPSGRSQTFDKGANGMARGEGAGLVILKPLSRALADGDRVWAVVLGSAVNQDGASNGLMAPNGKAQEAVIRQAYQRAGVSPGRVQYIEAHGTGTAVGDPIEVRALAAVLGEDRSDGRICKLGSIKTNIGHTEAAAGMAGLIKVALSMHNRLIPPSLHFQEPNPLLNLEETPLIVQQQPGPWPVETEPLIAGVSSFGIGGSNAHVVVAAPPEAGAAREDGSLTPPYLVPISARRPEALQELAQSYHELVSGDQAPELADLGDTASTRRSHLEQRLACVAHSREELAGQLTAFLEGNPQPGLSSGVKPPAGHQPKLAFIFSGQGSHWSGMGRELLLRAPVFRATLEQCDHLLRRHVEWSLLEILQDGEGESRLNETDVAQPAILAIQVALAALWRAWGIIPDVVAGQSLGEIAAAHVAGALSLEDAIRVVYHRSRLMKRTAGQGKTAVIGLSPDRARLIVTGFEELVSVAGSNSPETSVLSGEPEALARILTSLEGQGVFCRYLQNVDIAFHSPQMEPLREELVQALEGLQPRPAVVPVYSTVLGALVEGTQFDAAYWGRNLREPFLFSQVIQQLVANGIPHFLEVSPHPVLSASILEGMAQASKEGVVIPSLRRQEEEWSTMLASLGRLFTLGYEVEWNQLYGGTGKRVSLPAYPWQRERYWIDQLLEGQDGATYKRRKQQAGLHPLLGEHLKLSFPQGQFVWETELSAYSLPYLNEHRIRGTAVLPGAAYLEMVLSAAAQLFGNSPCVLEDVSFKHALFLPEEGGRRIQVVFTTETEGLATFRISSALPGSAQQASSSWMLHAAGQVRTGKNIATTMPEPAPLEQLRPRAAETVSGAAHYEAMARRGLQYGPSFRTIEEIWQQEDEALGRLEVASDLIGKNGAYQVHPVVLDAGFQIVARTAAASSNGADSGKTYLPVGVERMQVYQRPAVARWCYARMRPGTKPDDDVLEADTLLIDEKGQMIATILGLRLQNIEKVQQVAPEATGDWLYEIEWRPKAHGRKATAQPSGFALEQLLEEIASSGVHTEGEGSWLIFADEGGAGRQLAELLRTRGERCVLISAAETFQNPEPDRYLLNPERLEEFQRLLAESLPPGQPACRGIVHLWALDSGWPADPAADSLEQAKIRSCYTAIHLVQALTQVQWNKLPRLWFVTRGGQPVGGQQVGGETAEQLAVHQALLWGVGRVVAMEHPELWGGIVDLDPERPSAEAGKLFEELWMPDGENQIAFRDQARYVARLARSQQPAPNGQPPRFRADGSYLITGGLSGLGLAVAQWMVENGARRLILMGRTAFPPRPEWGQVDENSSLAERIAAVKALEAKGASVHLAPVDVSDDEQIGAFLKQYRREGWPPIRGLVHSAGLTRDQLLMRMDQEAFDAPLGPKMLGAWSLHRLLAGEPLDFFVLFSSITATLGMFGQANYAAGNAFMDALAHYRRAQGLPAMSINWGEWAEIGMAARMNLQERRIQNGMGAIAPEQGLQLLGQLLQQQPVQVAVMPVNWQAWRKTAYPLYADFEEELTEPGRAGDGQPNLMQELLLFDSQAERQRFVEAQLQGSLAAIMRLKPDQLDPRRPLDTLGLDSIMAVELKNRIEASLGVTFSIVDLLQGASLSNLAERVLDKLHLQDDQKIAELLAMVEQLSVEEAEQLLVGEGELVR